MRSGRGWVVWSFGFLGEVLLGYCLDYGGDQEEPLKAGWRVLLRWMDGWVSRWVLQGLRLTP